MVRILYVLTCIYYVVKSEFLGFMPLSLVQDWLKRWLHLLSFIQMRFLKIARKVRKNAVKTDCIYFDREFWLFQLGSNQ